MIRKFIFISTILLLCYCTTVPTEQGNLSVLYALGKGRDSKEFLEVRQALGTPKVNFIDKSLYYSYKNYGLQFEKDTLVSIWYFNSGRFYEDRWPYRSIGVMPLNLTLSDTKETIVDKIGIPTRSFNDGYYEVWRYLKGIQMFFK